MIGLALATLGATLAGAAGQGGEGLHGTVRSGERLESNAVVWLDAPGAPRDTGRAKVVLDQRNLKFLPHILAVRVGTEVEFPNNDRVFHNVFSFHDGKPFDLGIYPVGTARRHRFDELGLSRIFCNIHANMAAYVMVVDTPYFAVANKSGLFTILSVPPSTYPYHAWRPGGPTLTGSTIVEPGKTLDIRWP